MIDETVHPAHQTKHSNETRKHRHEYGKNTVTTDNQNHANKDLPKRQEDYMHK
jgi:hypothetical protein